jgi:ankyrin repeat protein
VGIVQALVAAGACLNLATTDTGVTPLWQAAQEGQLDVVRVLLASDGIDTRHKANNGESALDAARRKGHDNVVELLEETLGWV